LEQWRVETDDALIVFAVPGIIEIRIGDRIEVLPMYVGTPS
jgi:hypothetical protein